MKHLFLYTLSSFCAIQQLYPGISKTLPSQPSIEQQKRLHYQEVRKRIRKAHSSIFRSIVLPQTATPKFEYNLNLFTTILLGLTSAGDWLQPIHTRAAYDFACKNGVQARWTLLYSVIWWMKKILACNKIYRVGARIRQKPHILGCIVNICQMLAIGGDGVAEPEHLQQVSEKIWGDRFKSWGSGNK